MTTQIKLSPTALNLFLSCPRCFWLEKVRGVKRPRGIFPSLPGGMDRVIKKRFDACRRDAELPRELRCEATKGVGLYKDQARLDRWRNWRTGLVYKDAKSGGAVLSGAFDDLLTRGERFIPFDYKTKGSVTTESDAVKYYQNQLDCYALMLAENDMPVAPFGILLYYSPKEVKADGVVRFETQVIRVATDIERARAHFRDAVASFASPLPERNGRCEHCDWVAALRKV